LIGLKQPNPAAPDSRGVDGDQLRVSRDTFGCSISSTKKVNTEDRKLVFKTGPTG
jgi:hypothetical protein